MYGANADLENGLAMLKSVDLTTLTGGSSSTGV